MSEGLLWKVREAFASRKPAKVAKWQRARLTEMVAYARANSPYYRDLYRDLPDQFEDPTLLRRAFEVTESALPLPKPKPTPKPKPRPASKAKPERTRPPK